MRALLSGWGKLVSTNVLGALLQLAVFALCAQVLELAALGVLVLIQTWVKVVEGLVNFQSVNVLTRYFAEADERQDMARFRGLVKAGLLVDGGGALASTIIAIALVPLAGEWFGLPPEWHLPAQIFGLVILTRIYGVTEASLRCFDRFWLIGLRPVAISALMLVATVAAWLTGAPPVMYLYAWLGAEVLVNGCFIALTLYELRRHGVKGIRRADARAVMAQGSGFWPMLWNIKATFSLRMLSQDADVLLASSLLGPSAAALLRAVKNVAAMVNQLGRPLQQVASAPITRLAAQGRYREMATYARQINLAAGGVSLLFVVVAMLAGDHLLALVYGPQFAAAQWPLAALLLTASLYMFGVALLPMVIAMDRAAISFEATVVGTVVFVALLLSLAAPFGLMGIALAHVGFNASWLATSWLRANGAVARVSAAAA